MATLIKCTQDMLDTICNALKAGQTRRVSAMLAGIPPDIFSGWLDAGERDSRSRFEEEGDPLTPEQGASAEFYRAVTLAELEWETAIVEAATNCAKNDPRIGLQMLRCRRPDEWTPARAGSVAAPVAPDGRAPGAAPVADAQPSVQNRIAILPDSQMNPSLFQDCPRTAVIGPFRALHENRAHIAFVDGVAKFVPEPKPEVPIIYPKLNGPVIVVEPEDAAWYGQPIPDYCERLAHPTGIHAVDDDGKTTLMQAAEQGDLEQVEALIAAKLYVNERDNDGATALMYGCMSTGNADCINALIDAHAHVNAVDRDNATALCWAATYGNDDCVEALLDAEANLEAKYRPNGRTALALAADEGWIDVVDLLVDAGANVNARDDQGHTPMSLAAARGYREIVDILKAAGAR
ncbi:MAG: ankyrin repeat domain-containing protein [Capsulimonadaceae bacterium]